MDNQKKGGLSVIVLATIAILAIAVVVVVYLGIPSLRKLKTNSETAAQEQANITNGTEYITNIENAYSRLTANAEAVNKLNIASPVTPDVAGAMVQLEAIASSAGVSITSASPSRGENNEVEISIRVSGAYENVQNFLSGMENNLRPFIISAIAVSGYENSDGQIYAGGNYEIELSYVGSTETTTENAESTGETVTVSSEGSNNE